MAWDDIRETTLAAANAAAALVDRLGDDDLGRPGLGVWDVRGLLGHLYRALDTPLAYLAEPAPDGDPLPSPAHYCRAYLAQRRVDAAESDRRIAERGAAMFAGSTAAEIGASFAAAATALEGLRAESPDRLLSTPFGPIRLVDYLPTRIMEMVTHTLDLSRAIGTPWEVDREALVRTLALLTDIAIDSGRGPDLVLELTGRTVEPSALPVLR